MNVRILRCESSRYGRPDQVKREFVVRYEPKWNITFDCSMNQNRPDSLDVHDFIFELETLCKEGYSVENLPRKFHRYLTGKANTHGIGGINGIIYVVIGMK